jgi:hypothetical protein
MTDALRSLRWYAGLAVVFFGILPMVLVTLLVVAALVIAVRGMIDADPDRASRRLHLSMTLVAAADVLVLGGNALIRMGSS